MSLSSFITFAFASAALQGTIALAQTPPTSPELPNSYEVRGATLSFFNTPNRRHTIINADNPMMLGKVTVDLTKQSDVLVQFSSGITTVVPDGCPCSVRFSLKVDEQEPVVIKRINIGAVSNTVGTTYQPDRQSADGSYVFTLPRGSHEVSLIAQRVDGSSKMLYAFYQNIQAIKFER